MRQTLDVRVVLGDHLVVGCRGVQRPVVDHCIAAVGVDPDNEVAVGGSLLIYIILWIIMPNAPDPGTIADFKEASEPEEVEPEDEEQSTDSEADED